MKAFFSHLKERLNMLLAVLTSKNVVLFDYSRKLWIFSVHKLTKEQAKEVVDSGIQMSRDIYLQFGIHAKKKESNNESIGLLPAEKENLVDEPIGKDPVIHAAVDLFVDAVVGKPKDLDLTNTHAYHEWRLAVEYEKALKEEDYELCRQIYDEVNRRVDEGIEFSFALLKSFVVFNEKTGLYESTDFHSTRLNGLFDRYINEVLNKK